MITSSTDRVAPAAPLAGHDALGLLRVLLIEHRAADAAVIEDYLHDCAECGRAVGVECVSRMAQACEMLVRQRFDIVLLDLSVPDGRGVAGVKTLSSVAPDVPIVAVAAAGDDTLAAAAVMAGAQDYLTKGQDDGRVVRHAVRHAIERHRLRREREALLVREREARAAAERATRVRDEVLGMVSHDLRSPLTAIAMSANALLDGSGDVPTLASAIARSSEWALHIIRDLLDVTAIEAGRLTIHREPMTAQAITEMLWSMFAPSAASAGVTLEVERPDPALWVDADVDRVVQAVGNFLGNAIKFTPRGGRVSLTVSRDVDAIRFRVMDTGCGIAPEDIPRLFDRYWQAHESRRGGAGLGLPIAKGIAEGHGGRIDVESRLGVGSTFTFVLPEQP
jgi:signal transduction histidine kinase